MLGGINATLAWLSLLQKLPEILAAHCLLTQDLHHVVQKFHNDPVYLSILLLHGLVALFLKFQFLMFQFLLHLALQGKLIENGTVFRTVFFPPLKLNASSLVSSANRSRISLSL